MPDFKLKSPKEASQWNDAKIATGAAWLCAPRAKWDMSTLRNNGDVYLVATQ